MRRIFVGDAACGQKIDPLLFIGTRDCRADMLRHPVETGGEKAVIPCITPSQVAVLALAERLIRGV